MKREPVRDELSFEQKVWKGGQTLLWSLRPVALYLFFPALLMSVGMLLFGGRSAETVIGRSGNFYYALGMAATVFLLHKRSRKQGSSLWEESTLEYKGMSLKRAALLGAAGLGFAVFFSSVITVVPFPRGLMDSYHSSSDSLRNGTDIGLAMISTVFLAPAAEVVYTKRGNLDMHGGVCPVSCIVFVDDLRLFHGAFAGMGVHTGGQYRLFHGPAHGF